MSTPQDLNQEIDTMSAKLTSATTFTPTNTQEQLKVAESNNSPSCRNLDSKRSCTIQENVRNLPELNIPEKILFVVDTVKEENYTPFKVGTGESYPPLYMIKRVVETFINAKSTIQRKHEYGLMILDSAGTRWICDFTNNIKIILTCLDTIEESSDEEKTFDIGQVFKEIQSQITVKSYEITLPMFTTRVILIYSRSNCIPRFHSGQKCLTNLTENPYFFLDVLFVHEPPTAENLCEKVYAEIITLDTTNFSYILEVGRNAAKLHDNMAKLLAHPLQRPPQKDMCYTINESIILPEVHTNV
ncbi:hypothetical protein KPH14_012100 [Odynerus spinipes]|uniref:BRISC and BRCA1-A complex member 1 n=1 Tax=Odynerus spinipes TaxID=1348599 RepID=A0AAD9R9R3_9HYME|nr:hypothetical protein KPH14_012100 [Odynerus spinipes]